MITGRGAGLLVASLIALASGFVFGYPELVILGTSALVAVGFATVYAIWRPALRVTRAAEPDRVSRGAACRVTLSVSNGSRLRALTLLAEDRCGARKIPVPLVRLRPRRETEVSYPVPTDRRGVVPIGPLRVTRQDPLGLAALSRGHGDTVLVWVYPRILPLSAVPVGVARSLDGRIDRVPHGSITFDTLREYVIGDELRKVHWRTSARAGQLMVREHLDTSLPRIVVLLDDRAGSYPDAAAGVSETFESACEAAASVVAAAVREELPIALHLVAGTATGSPSGTATALVTELRSTAGGAAPPWAAAWRLLARALGPKPPGGGTGHGPGAADPAAGRPAFIDTGGRRTESARPFLDLLAEAGLHTGARAGEPALRTAVDRLRHHQAGDTLVFLTGAGGRAGLGDIAALRGRYPSLMAAVFTGPGPGVPAQRLVGPAGAGAGATDAGSGASDSSVGKVGVAGTGVAGLPRAGGLLVLDARDSADFAAEWEGVRGW